VGTGGGADTGPAPIAGRLRERLAPLADLRGLIELLSFDQETVMPPAGATARAHQEATLHGLLHEGLIAPELADLLAEAQAAGVQGDDAALVRVVGRDADKARRVPTELVKAMAMAGNEGQEAWAKARENDDFEAFLPYLERNLDLRREYAACFDVAEPYDALLDDFEPGMLTSDVREVFGPLREELPRLVAAAAERSPGRLAGSFPVDGQRRALDFLLRRVGFDDESWLLGESVHPFSATPGRGDNRITTRFAEDSLESALSGLHEFGHGLYEAQIDPALARTQLGRGVSMAVHESQSRLWEIFVGGSVAFWRGAWPGFTAALGGPPAGLGPEAFVGAITSVAPSLIRVDADPVSYPLHIILRFDLELALIAGDLAPRDLPAAWNEGMRALLGIVPPSNRLGILQDVHWSFGAFGYFPTYALGTILAAQIWAVVRRDLPELDAQLEAGELAPLREWLREKVHRHGKRLEPRDLIRSATGRELDAGPYLAYARGRAGLAEPQ
jgi:carboxypeptidase Taq